MHFLNKLIDNPKLDNPAKNHIDVHRHFYRYSRGDFIGPALKITQTKARITIKGSVEYEDLIQEFVASKVPDDELDIKAVLISGGDISKTILDLGLEWKLVKSKGKTQNYKVNYTGKINKNILIKSIQTFRASSYFLVSFTINPTCKVTTKMRIPQPSKKKVEEDDVNKRISFCSGILNNTEKNLKKIIDSSLVDFKSEIPDKWKTILITNNYKIEDIQLPKNIKDSRLLRIMAIRKGRLTRSVAIDGDIIEKQYNFIA